MKKIFTRTGRVDTASEGVRQTVAQIIERVRTHGDGALRAMAKEFDGATLMELEVPKEKWRQALASLDTALVRAMTHSARNIRTAHAAFLPTAVEVEVEPGVRVGRRPDPLASVGVYAPGGRAAYPSSLLMAAVPARVAGVREVIVCSPPGANGFPSDVVLAAAALADVDRVFAIGGAGAIAAMAYGTASVPRVDRIVGPGNAYVAEAKLQVANVVGIDCPAGPSELLVIVDESVSADIVAREVLAQAEHDPNAAVVVVAVGDGVAQTVEQRISALRTQATRRAIIDASWYTHGEIRTASSLSEAVTLANAWAPEHLLLAVADPSSLLPRVRNAGAVFLGATSSVAFGDYMTGANHVLPTGGLARAYSGLSTADFVRWTTYQRVDRQAAARLAEDVGVFANAEGLPAHADAARSWQGSRAGETGGSETRPYNNKNQSL